MFRIYARHQALKDFERYVRELNCELLKQAPRKYLDVYVRLLEELVEKTGGSQATHECRAKLITLKAMVSHRGNMRLIAERS